MREEAKILLRERFEKDEHDWGSFKPDAILRAQANQHQLEQWIRGYFNTEEALDHFECRVKEGARLFADRSIELRSANKMTGYTFFIGNSGITRFPHMCSIALAEAGNHGMLRDTEKSFNDSTKPLSGIYWEASLNPAEFL